MTRTTLTPTLLARAATCRHSWYLETHVEAELKAEPDAGMALLLEGGREHERRMVARLDKPVEPAWDGRDFEAGYRATLALMEEGADWIYQAPLCRDDVRGVVDLLERVDGASAMGAYSYVPVDIKGHQAVSKKDRIQLHAYAWMLEPALGSRPDTGGIWLNTGQIDYVDLSARLDEFGDLYQGLHAIRAGGTATVPLRCGECGMCPWSEVCDEEWQRSRSVTLLAGATGATARALFEAGYARWPAVAAASAAALAAATGFKLEKATRLKRSADAWRSGAPELLRPVTFPAGVPIHYYDIETYGETVYLHGLIRVFDGEREARQFAARTPEDEASIWREFLDYLARDEEALVYCWSNYEVGYAKRLWDAHGGNAAGYGHLQTMQDQCAFVKEHFALPAGSYSIKAVAPVFGFHWDADDAGGLNSAAWYGQWLASRDEALFDKILRYNLDDVVAMEVIDQALRARFG